MLDKLLSGRFLLTIACAVVFIWASFKGILPAAAVASIIATVFTFYFVQGQNNDNKPKPPSSPSAGPVAIAAVMLALLVCAPAIAETITVGPALQKIPAIKEGFMYDWKQNRVVNLATMEIANYKGFSLEGGYLGTDGVVAVASYNIGGLEKLGIKLPILDLINLNLGFGAGVKTITLPARSGDPEGDNRVVFGVTATLVQSKF